MSQRANGPGSVWRLDVGAVLLRCQTPCRLLLSALSALFAVHWALICLIPRPSSGGRGSYLFGLLGGLGAMSVLGFVSHHNLSCLLGGQINYVTIFLTPPYGAELNLNHQVTKRIRKKVPSPSGGGTGRGDGKHKILCPTENSEKGKIITCHASKTTTKSKVTGLVFGLLGGRGDLAVHAFF